MLQMPPGAQPVDYYHQLIDDQVIHLNGRRDQQVMNTCASTDNNMQQITPFFHPFVNADMQESDLRK